MKENFKGASFHFKDFLESVVWHDMKLMINDLRENLRDHLEVQKDLEEIYRFQGRAEFATVMLNLPQTILDLMEGEKEEEEVELPDEPDELDM